MAIEYLSTEQFSSAISEFLNILTKLTAIKKEIEDATNDLYAHWVGKSRNEFERQYGILFSKISDINDALDEMYNLMVDAEVAYQDTDDAIRQQLAMAASN